jgi:hypothetical protein
MKKRSLLLMIKVHLSILISMIMASHPSLLSKTLDPPPFTLECFCLPYYHYLCLVYAKTRIKCKRYKY